MESFKFKKLIVSGANGFTGRHVCEELISRNIKFSVILRPGTNHHWMNKKQISVFYSDLNDTNKLSKILKNFDALINIASLGFGNAKPIVEACEKAYLKRVVFLSSTSIYTSLNASSKKIRKNAENIIKKSSLIWSIIRPTMIYGTPKDRNMIKLITWIDKVPLIPIFGNGNSLQQPIYVKDLATFIVDVLENENSFRNDFNLSGKNPLTFNEIIKLISEILNKKPLKIYLPYLLCVKIISSIEYLKIKFPLKSEQILRLNENKSFSYDKAFSLIGYDPTDFKDGIKNEIEMYKKLKGFNKFGN